MRSIQKIFNVVIEAGLYGSAECEHYMCISLHAAARAGVISAAEEEFATDAIDEYLEDLYKVHGGQVRTALATALNAAGVPEALDRKYRLELYQNWANRPHAPTRSVQAVFRAVIKAGYYDKDAAGMCHALYKATQAGVITYAERAQNKKVIDKYLEDLRGSRGTRLFLETALAQQGLPYSFEDRKAVYLNWAERPRLKGKRTIQQIFNAALDSEQYCVVGDFSTGCSIYMCNALHVATRREVITEEEYAKAKAAIAKYMEGFELARALVSCLEEVGLPCAHSDCVAIYRNWKARPKLKPKS